MKSLDFKVKMIDLPKTIGHKKYLVTPASKNKNKDVEEAIKKFNKNIEEGSKNIENELIKTDLDVKVIIKFIEEINKMKEGYGIHLPNIDFEYIHKIMHKIHFLIEKRNEINGYHDNETEKIVVFGFKEDEYVNEENYKKKFFEIINNYHTLLHELVHFNSYLSEKINPRDFEISQELTIGYKKIIEIRDNSGHKKDMEQLSEFNEGVTEMITLELINSNAIKSFFEKEIDGILFESDIETTSYFKERNQIKSFIKKISEKHDVSEDNVWNEIKKAFFDGDGDGVLKKIEEAYQEIIKEN